MNSLHCSSDHNKLIPLLIRMVTKEAFEEDKGADDSTAAAAGFSVHIHGSLIVQELLRFQKPIKAVRIQSRNLSRHPFSKAGQLHSQTVNENSKKRHKSKFTNFQAWQ